MGKPKRTAPQSAIKKEECEDKSKLQNLLRTVNSTTSNKSKVTKSRSTNQPQQFVKVKAENTGDIKQATSATLTKLTGNSTITYDQVTKLIIYIVNDKLSVTAASKKAGIPKTTAQRYYREYYNDPEHNIPLPKIGIHNPSSRVTQKKIDDLIHYIVHEQMSLNQAAIKAKLCRVTANKYYAKYMEDPEHKIPNMEAPKGGYAPKRHTQEQLNNLVDYTIKDKMSISAASKKLNMSLSTARKHYLKYLRDSNNDTPDAQGPNKIYTDSQVSSLISYIIHDGMDLFTASIKANMDLDDARRYYKLYLNDPDHNIPSPETDNKSRDFCNKLPSLDNVKRFFNHIIVDKDTISQAALKANISGDSARRYYTKYLKRSVSKVASQNNFYSVEKMKKWIELVQSGNMTFTAAANTVHIVHSTAVKYYRQYMMDPQRRIPEVKERQYTKEDIKKLIHCIENEKMTIRAASRKNNILESSGQRYYKIYQNDPEHRIPVPSVKGHAITKKVADRYLQIIADIYKNNPSIKPMNEGSLVDADSSDADSNVKQEDLDIDVKQEDLDIKEELKHLL